MVPRYYFEIPKNYRRCERVNAITFPLVTFRLMTCITICEKEWPYRDHPTKTPSSSFHFFRKTNENSKCRMKLRSECISSVKSMTNSLPPFAWKNVMFLLRMDYYSNRTVYNNHEIKFGSFLCFLTNQLIVYDSCKFDPAH